MTIKFGVVVNYFKKTDHPESVKQSLIFALSQLKNCDEVNEIVVSDGSVNKDDELIDYCNRRNIKYLHIEGGMSFPEAYNYGVAQLQEEWIAIMASDIYVLPDTFTAFANFIRSYGKLNIGCLIPYISNSAYITQESYKRSSLISCYSGLMTFNLNVFKKSVYDKISGMSSDYSGNYNDVDAVLRLKKLNLNIILVKNAYAIHYGRLTLSHGSNTNVQEDYNVFKKKYPRYCDEKGLWNIKMELFLQNPILIAMYKLKNIVPSKKIRNKYLNMILKMIPIFQKIT